MIIKGYDSLYALNKIILSRASKIYLIGVVMWSMSASRNTSLASALFSVISILVGLFILTVYSLIAVEVFNPLVAFALENFELTEVPNAEQSINNMFTMAFGTVPWIAGFGLIIVGVVNEYRRRRTISRQRVRP